MYIHMPEKKKKKHDTATAGAPCHVTRHSLIGYPNFIGNEAIDPRQTGAMYHRCTLLQSGNLARYLAGSIDSIHTAVDKNKYLKYNSFDFFTHS
jgi:hypothetical protein